MTGTRPGSPPGGATGGGAAGGDPSEGQNSNLGGRRAPEDVGILVYIDRQRYGQVTALREIPIAQVAEIRFLTASEANSEFGMGHPDGLIQIVTKRGPSRQ
jgi:hypothetical protein